MFDLVFNLANLIVIAVGFSISLWFYIEYKKTKSRALLNSLPGVFTSLGLLGTFGSICYSLYDIGPKTSQNPDILKIISELIPAFTSSILGLIFALGATVWVKWIFAREEHEENERLFNRTPEDYIKDIAENCQELIQIQKNQEQKYKEYNDNLNSNIKNQNEILKAFIEGFVNKMDGIFQGMREAIEQQVNNFGEEQFTKTSQLLATITEKLVNVSSDIINQQKSSVELMMTKTNEDINGISTTVTTVLGNLANSLQVSLDNLGNKQTERLNGIMSNYDNLATKLSEQNTDFAKKVTEQMQTEYTKVQEHNVQSLQQMVDLRNAYQETTSNLLTSTLSMNEKATADLRDTMSGFVTDIQALVATQCSSLSSAISTNVESLNKAYSFIESLVAEIKQNYDQAVLAYGDAVNVAHRTNENSEKVIAATSKSLESVEQTNKMIDSVLTILTDRQENIEELTKHISSMSATIESLQRLESSLNKIANK